MRVLIRAFVYAALFIGIVLVLVPARLLGWTGIAAPAAFGVRQAVGLAMTLAGAALALWCVLAFATLGNGTPAPFDPPRRLVVRGPYRSVRNPMYLGAGLALLGAALAYGSLALAGYAAVLGVTVQLFVRYHEEPRLRRSFGADYEEYRARVGRWWPRRARRRP